MSINPFCSYLCYLIYVINYLSCFILLDDFIVLIFNLAICIFGLHKNKSMRTFDAPVGFRPFQIRDLQVTLSKTSFASAFVRCSIKDSSGKSRRIHRKKPALKSPLVKLQAQKKDFILGKFLRFAKLRPAIL